MVTIFDDPSKSYIKIKNTLIRDSISINLIASELSRIKDIKDQKSVVDFLIREQILFNIELADIEKVKYFLNLSIDLLRKEFVNTSLPFLLFSDVFNSLTIKKCEDFFAFMEECVQKLKDTPIFASGRTMLLRICNDLLRRLSKSQDTVFCGRIQIFLSRLFPLDEKSGLNLMGHFNIDNLTPYNITVNEENDNEDTEDISIDLTDDKNISLMDIDDDIIQKTTPKFYRQFWSLQDYFRSPNQVYLNTDKFSEFSENVANVLNFFSKIRFTRPKISNINGDSTLQKKETDDKPEWSCFTNSDITFTKYLTNEKLFDLQLMDVGFRRCFLLQLSVTFQYLLLQPCKFKTPDQVLSDAEKKWVLEKQEETDKLMDEMSYEPEEPFYNIVDRILSRESVKSLWKQDGCQSFVKRNSNSSEPTQLWNPRQLRINRIQINPENKSREVCFDKSTELGRLWRLTPDHLAACRAEERVRENAKPLRQNLQKVLEEIKSGQSKKLNDEKWVWGTLRLLSRKSAYFYNNWSSPGQQMSVYLTDIIKHESQSDTTSNNKPTNKISSLPMKSEDSSPPTKKTKLSDNGLDQESSKEKTEEQDNCMTIADTNNHDEVDDGVDEDDEEVVDGEVGGATGVDEPEEVSDSEMPENDADSENLNTTESGEIQD